MNFTRRSTFLALALAAAARGRAWTMEVWVVLTGLFV